ncbi:hypothetical protein [Ornithinimicrobium sp. INDO-MA30-4]|uniref:hypothetical protein n=1 Tax=Ornithinimicrobium sp. INDO-MA30-4 TaxID=2908651 RepID=UPI001F336B92|nr:hypothetical protein [Ornithinimicrobium sp. INDO-MA30-4]UJH71738.1 hypothetical protein L0A91_16775 [Ornithinimicrobium sp. INDO-MA30-4]
MKHKELTQVDVEVDVKTPQSEFAAGSTHGTLIELTHLTNPWTAESFELLAREIWALQPPFATPTDDKDRFTITLKTPFPSVQASFDDQMEALMDIASAKIVGRLLPLGEAVPSGSQTFGLPEREPPSDEDGKLQSGQIEPSEDQPNEAPLPQDKSAVTRILVIDVALSGAAREKFVVDIPDCQITAFDFEIRVFDLRHRQPRGIKVNVARRYLSHFGGIHIYDNGFRMPYYGPEQDWLRLELDHARRLSRSELLPEELQVRNAMQDLPSNKRVFGAVNISTSVEQAAADGAEGNPVTPFLSRSRETAFGTASRWTN